MEAHSQDCRILHIIAVGLILRSEVINDGFGIVRAGRRAAKVACPIFALRYRLNDGILDL